MHPLNWAVVVAYLLFVIVDGLRRVLAERIGNGAANPVAPRVVPQRPAAPVQPAEERPAAAEKAPATPAAVPDGDLLGATLAVLTVPSVIGMMLGAQIGARLLSVLKASVVRKLVLGLLLFAGARALQKGLGFAG